MPQAFPTAAILAMMGRLDHEANLGLLIPGEGLSVAEQPKSGEASVAAWALYLCISLEAVLLSLAILSMALW